MEAQGMHKGCWIGATSQQGTWEQATWEQATWELGTWESGEHETCNMVRLGTSLQAHARATRDRAYGVGAEMAAR